MKVFKKSIFSALAAVVAFGASSHVFGAGLPVYTDLGDTGTLEIDSNPPAFPPGVASLGHPYSNTAITAPGHHAPLDGQRLGAHVYPQLQFLCHCQ